MVGGNLDANRAAVGSATGACAAHRTFIRHPALWGPISWLDGPISPNGPISPSVSSGHSVTPTLPIKRPLGTKCA